MNTKRIKDLRIDHDLSQQDVANVLQISRQYYTRYEAGQVDFPIRHLITLAKYYNVTLDYLVGLSNQTQTAANSQNISKNDFLFLNEMKKVYKKYYGDNEK